MDSVAFLLRFLQASRVQDRCALRVHLDGVPECARGREPENLLQHLDDVVVGVIVVVQQNDVLQGLELVPRFIFDFRQNRGGAGTHAEEFTAAAVFIQSDFGEDPYGGESARRR